MIYVLEGHGLKHAVEEMLLHLTPAELPAQGDAAPETGDYCISRLRVVDGVAQAAAEARLDGVTRTASWMRWGKNGPRPKSSSWRFLTQLCPACRKSPNGAA